MSDQLAQEERLRLLVQNAADVREAQRIRQGPPGSGEALPMAGGGSRDVLSYRYRFLPEPKCEYMSPGAQTILGIAPEAFYADPDLWRTLVHPDDLESLEA